MNINPNNFLIKKALNVIQHYNHEKYWRMRSEVINPHSKMPVILKLYYLLRIKKMDAYHNASLGTNLGKGAIFDSPPLLPHGLNGIVIGHDVKIGKNCTIWQQVTVMQGTSVKSVVIGDNCILGTGSKILGGVQIGNNVKIGANAVVVNDIPDNCTAVGIPAHIVKPKIKTLSSAK
ncbi:DapH/DapD/GlmU-related protein [Neobacillus drentensis]